MRVLWFLLSACLISAGCGPAVSQEDLGKVVYGVPAVPGTDAPYPLPELEVSASEGNEHGGHDGHAH
jgi:hypothetical protein